MHLELFHLFLFLSLFLHLPFIFLSPPILDLLAFLRFHFPSGLLLPRLDSLDLILNFRPFFPRVYPKVPKFHLFFRTGLDLTCSFLCFLCFFFPFSLLVSSWVSVHLLPAV